MEAKDTVMNNKKFQLLGQQYEDEVPTCDFNHYALEAQAEISFKAGYEQGGLDSYSVDFAEGKRTGIREVVEWMRQEEIAIPEYKLKEWGIDED